MAWHSFITKKNARKSWKDDIQEQMDIVEEKLKQKRGDEDG